MSHFYVWIEKILYLFSPTIGDPEHKIWADIIIKSSNANINLVNYTE